MSILARLKTWWAGRQAAGEDTSGFDVEQFVYVKIPGHIEPMARGAIEDRIEPRLRESGLGEISGGGSQLGDERPDGTRPIEFCGIDIDTADRDAALALLRNLLPTLDVPPGTELHYTRGGERLLDSLGASGWDIARPRMQMHPGFGF